MSRLSALVDALARRTPRGMELGLDRIRDGLCALGDPHRAVPAVHIAGTNGKGSTAAMVESIARCAGLRTGLTTSPHLSRFAERIRVDGAPIDPAPFEAALDAALSVNVGRDSAFAGPSVPPAPLTFFEAITAAAFVAFRDAGVDLAILEVGLGGRLDATNVVEAPLCTAITSIALDHTDTLGSTIPCIAREKAGILKPGAPAVLGPLDPEAQRAIEAIAVATGAGPIRRVTAPLEGTALGLRGPHQAWNAAVAAEIAAVLSARWPAMEAAIPAGLAGARWPGRMELLDSGDHLGHPEAVAVRVLFDCAHNPHGVHALAAALAADAKLWEGPQRTTLVFGALANKAWPEVLRAIAPAAARRVYTCPKGRSPAPLEALQSIAPGEAVPDPRAALARAMEMTAPGGLVVVTGSIYLVGEIRAAMLGIEADPIVAL